MNYTWTAEVGLAGVPVYGPVLPRAGMGNSQSTGHGGPGPRPGGTFYRIRNGDLSPHYDPVKARALPILVESLGALTHHQADGDFYRMYVYAQRDKCEFNLTGIPSGLLAAIEGGV